MAASSTTFTAARGALSAVERTHAAHASALGALERAFGAEIVRSGVPVKTPMRLARIARHL
jgi:hypothetical protein